MPVNTIWCAAVLATALAAPGPGGHAYAQQAAPIKPPAAQGQGGHAQHTQAKPKPKPQEPARPADPATHQGHEGHKPPAPLPPHVPPLTDEDRRAAFPDVKGHTVHDTAMNYYVLFDQFEWRAGGDESGLSLDNRGWIGGDIDRFWFRAEGEMDGSDVGEAQAHALYGRAVARWWDLVAGVRQDVRPGPARTWAAIGIQGLAPYWFEVEATAYVGAGGRTHFRFETEYELLLTNRLILQPLAEVEIYGKSDPERGIGAGLSSLDAGLRLRYEIRRELAPYVGVTWSRKFFGTKDLAEAAGEESDGARLALGLRFWF